MAIHEQDKQKFIKVFSETAEHLEKQDLIDMALIMTERVERIRKREFNAFTEDTVDEWKKENDIPDVIAEALKEAVKAVGVNGLERLKDIHELVEEEMGIKDIIKELREKGIIDHYIQDANGCEIGFNKEAFKKATKREKAMVRAIISMRDGFKSKEDR